MRSATAMAKPARSTWRSWASSRPGTWVLVFLDAAREVLSARDAARIGDALKALALIGRGETDVDHLFADLIGREPELPEHLKPKPGEFESPPHPNPLPKGRGSPAATVERAFLLPLGRGTG